MQNEVLFQETETRDEDKSSDIAKYKIIIYGADFTLEVLYNKLEQGEIVIPPFQRRYVWSPTKASRLIESFLLGLPVPQVFLYREEKRQKICEISSTVTLQTFIPL